ncbi:ribosomal RNA-processing protein 8 isoform X2 [Zootermopsis nevadensis]|uniref:ribosomal RNA-processing protein 8 isoform X2 n=1 Tax=Zootermopsis nevadensis TaxID=136037 RepID=UPI000B8E83D2|nr:ribosomal RNA-processing protein 8 isoform X2 [Zootermopsis nevadensis]
MSNTQFTIVHSSNVKKIQKKSRKNVKTKIKYREFFPTKINQDMHMPVLKAARSKTKDVKTNCMPLPNSANNMQNFKRKKIKNKGRDMKNLSYGKCKYHSFDNETRTCNSELSEANLTSKQKRKRSLSFDTEPVHCRNKRKKVNTTCSQDDPLSLVSNISDKPTESEKKELTKINGKKQSKKKQKNVINSRMENVSENFEKLGSASKSPYSINKLKQILAASNANKELSKESISEKKQVKETGSLRERMMKRLQASRFRYLNEQLYTSNGKNAKKYFEAEPEAFEAYHKGYQQQVQQWPINPLDIIITALKKKSSKLLVADFGCGDAHLAHSIPNKVYSFDLVATAKEVTACNMARTPLSTASVDVVVFCLSLMGTDLSAYLTEANRVLKEGGLLKIAEVESRFEDVQTFIQKLKKFGFVNTWKDLSHNLFYFMDFKKEKCISKKMKKKLPELILKPCLYKKR